MNRSCSLVLVLGGLSGLAVCLEVGQDPRTTQSSAEVVVARGASQPQVALGDGGAVHVAFFRAGDFWVATSKDGGRTFAEAVVAIDAGGRAHSGAQRGVRIAACGGDRLCVTAPVAFDPKEAAKQYPTADLYLVRSQDGGASWSPPERVNREPKRAPEALHWMAASADGVVHVAWLDLRDRTEPGQDLWYSRFEEGDSSGENVKVAETVCECCAPGLALDGRGNPYVAWREGGDKDSREIYSLRSTDGGRSFSRAERVNPTGTKENTCPMSAPAVALTQEGDKFAIAWKDRCSGRPDVHWTRPGAPPEDAGSRVSERGAWDQDHPALAFDDRGICWIVWEQRESEDQFLRSRSSAPGDPVRVVGGASGDRAGFPALAAADGLVALVYESERDGELRVCFRWLHGEPTH